MTTRTTKRWAAPAIGAALALAIGAAPAAAQSNDGVREAARVTFERAAYAAEHERDFERAIKLYEAALAAAEAEGDTSTAKRAREAVTLLRERRGDGAAPSAPSAPLEPGTAERLHALVRELCTGDDATAEIAFEDIQLFGAAAVPELERALHAATLLTPHQRRLIDAGVLSESGISAPIGNSTASAELLEQLAQTIPEAHEALVRGVRAKDPSVRRAVVDATTDWRILVVGARDAVPAIRDRAIDELVSGTVDRNDEIAAVMAQACKRGSQPAAEWIAWYVEKPVATLLEILLDPGANEATRAATVTGLASIPSNAAELAGRADELLDPLLDAIEAGGGARIAAESVLASLLGAEESSVEIGDAQAVRVLEVVLRWLETPRLPSSPSRLRMIARHAEARALEALLRHDATRVSHSSYKTLAEHAARRGYLPDRFGALAKRTAELDGHRLQKTLYRTLCGAEADPATVLGALELFEGEDQLDYIEAVLSDSDTFDASFLPALRKAILANPADPRVTEALRRVRDEGDLAALDGVIAVLRCDGEDFAEFDAYSWDSVNGLREAALEALAKLAAVAPPEVVTMLEPAILAEDLERRGQSADDAAFTYIVTTAGLPADHALAMIERLWSSCESETIRGALAFTLVQRWTGDRAWTDAVAAHFPEIEWPEWRQQALLRFRDELYEPAIPLLGDLLADPDGDVRKAAHDAFQTFKQLRDARAEFDAWQAETKEGRETISELEALLASDDDAVVIGAVRSLGILKARAALPKIVKLLGRKDAPELSKAVHEAIGRMSDD